VYLRKHGAQVEVRDDSERAAFQAERGVPAAAASCHTAIVEGYAIEGHVPMGAIRQLLRERPEAVGLALPGMPADAPGMGGNPETWESQPVMLITHDGRLVPFDY